MPNFHERVTDRSEGGGLWHPEAAPTAAMRRAIDRDSSRLKAVLGDDRIRKEFLGGCGKSESAAVKAFVKSNRENALKTKPKGELKPITNCRTVQREVSTTC